MPIMIWIAIIIQAAILNFLDMGILLGIQFANASIGWCVHLPAQQTPSIRHPALLARQLWHMRDRMPSA
jgi:hypothetical protein